MINRIDILHKHAFAPWRLVCCKEKTASVDHHNDQSIHNNMEMMMMTTNVSIELFHLLFTEEESTSIIINKTAVFAEVGQMG